MTKWISVKERLPDAFQDGRINGVVVHEANDGIPYIAYRVGAKGFEDFYTGKLIAGNITHWMKLPEPPKEA